MCLFLVSQAYDSRTYFPSSFWCILETSFIQQMALNSYHMLGMKNGWFGEKLALTWRSSWSPGGEKHINQGSSECWKGVRGTSSSELRPLLGPSLAGWHLGWPHLAKPLLLYLPNEPNKCWHKSLLAGWDSCPRRALSTEPATCYMHRNHLFGSSHAQRGLGREVTWWIGHPKPYHILYRLSMRQKGCFIS